MAAKNPRTFVSGIIIVLISLYPSVWNQECVDGCNKPDFCNSNLTAPNPANCSSFYACNNFNWYVQPCAPGTEYDKTLCLCVNRGQADCLVCPSTTPRTTLPSSPCSNIPDPCENGVRYPDQSDCFSYYRCTDGKLGDKIQCTVGNDHGFCSIPGYPCAFDSDQAACIHADSNLDCSYRCVTTAVPETTQNFATSDITESHQTTSSLHPMTTTFIPTNDGITTSPLSTDGTTNSDYTTKTHISTQKDLSTKHSVYTSEGTIYHTTEEIADSSPASEVTSDSIDYTTNDFVTSDASTSQLEVISTDSSHISTDVSPMVTKSYPSTNTQEDTIKTSGVTSSSSIHADTSSDGFETSTKTDQTEMASVTSNVYPSTSDLDAHTTRVNTVELTSLDTNPQESHSDTPFTGMSTSSEYLKSTEIITDPGKETTINIESEATTSTDGEVLETSEASSVSPDMMSTEPESRTPTLYYTTTKKTDSTDRTEATASTSTITFSDDTTDYSSISTKVMSSQSESMITDSSSSIQSSSSTAWTETEYSTRSIETPSTAMEDLTSSRKFASTSDFSEFTETGIGFTTDMATTDDFSIASSIMPSEYVGSITSEIHPVTSESVSGTDKTVTQETKITSSESGNSKTSTDMYTTVANEFPSSSDIISTAKISFSTPGHTEFTTDESSSISIEITSSDYSSVTRELNSERTEQTNTTPEYLVTTDTVSVNVTSEETTITPGQRSSTSLWLESSADTLSESPVTTARESSERVTFSSPTLNEEEFSSTNSPKTYATETDNMTSKSQSTDTLQTTSGKTDTTPDISIDFTHSSDRTTTEMDTANITGILTSEIIGSSESEGKTVTDYSAKAPSSTEIDNTTVDQDDKTTDVPTTTSSDDPFLSTWYGILLVTVCSVLALLLILLLIFVICVRHDCMSKWYPSENKFAELNDQTEEPHTAACEAVDLEALTDNEILHLMHPHYKGGLWRVDPALSNGYTQNWSESGYASLVSNRAVSFTSNPLFELDNNDEVLTIESNGHVLVEDNFGDSTSL